MTQHTLHPFATTDRQREILASIVQHGGMKKATDALGLSTGTIGNVLATLKRRAALKGVDERVSPWVPSINDVLAEDWVVLE